MKRSNETTTTPEAWSEAPCPFPRAAGDVEMQECSLACLGWLEKRRAAAGVVAGGSEVGDEGWVSEEVAEAVRARVRDV